MARQFDRLAVPGKIRWRDGVLCNLVLAFTVATMPAPSHADTLAEASQAFADGQYYRAARIWRELARAGEPEAAFQLGLISDLGLGPVSNSTVSFNRYLQAARQGHAIAQFNVGVMLDAGTGPVSSQTAAAIWYARAASKGFARAEYNLGLLYAEGDGRPRNIGLARAWLSRAAVTLEAAQEHLEDLPVPNAAQTQLLVDPELLAAAVVSGANGEQSLELVWTSSESPPGTRFRVELDDASDGAGADDLGWIDVSAMSIPLPSGAPRRWRVLASDGKHVAASEWQPLDGVMDEPPPDSRIAIRFRSDDAQARAYASELADDIARNGLQIETVMEGDTEAEIAESEVRYFFNEDASLAREIATALPVLAGQTVLRPDPERDPGTVEIRLRGGTAP